MAIIMLSRFAEHPKALKDKSRRERLSAHNVPALLAHPDWTTPAPVMVWMHGRTVDKELDPGRYLRWIRSGVAVCALDLPGHGERFDRALQSPDATLFVIAQMLDELDDVVAALDDSAFDGVFDTSRVGVGGMSAGGMVTLRRFCDEHPYALVAVESTLGDFSVMDYLDRYPHELVDRLDPMQHIASWRPVPALMLHSEADQWAPVAGIRNFVGALRSRYVSKGADPDLVQLHTWPQTGAPYEHAGFGKVANDAKNMQVAFIRIHLLGQATGATDEAPR